MFDNEKASIIQIEQEKLAFIIDSSEFPSYSLEDSELDSPLSLFENRFTILGVDDSEILYNGAYNGKKSNLLANMFDTLTQNKPEYTFEDFKNGLIEPYILNLEYTQKIKYSDIEIIREWQLQHFIEIVSIESSVLISRMFDECQQSSNACNLLKHNKDIFDSIINTEKFRSSDELISMLKELTFLKGYNFDDLNIKEIFLDFAKFKKQSINWNNITPKQYSTFESEILKKRPTAAFTKSPLIFYSIKKAINWIEKVLSEEAISVPHNYKDLQVVYKETIQKAIQKSKVKIKEFESELFIYNKESLNKSSTYMNSLKGLKYSCFVDKFIYKYMVNEEDEKQAEYNFILNSFLSDNIDHHVSELERAIVYCSQATYYDQKFNLYSAIENIPENYNFSISFFITGILMYDISLDADLYRLYWSSFDETSELEHYSNLPHILVAEICDLYAADLFNKFINRLEFHFDKCQFSNKEIYIYSQLRKNRKIEFRSKIQQNHNDDSKDIYSDLFKEFLLIELDFIKQTKDIKISTEIRPLIPLTKLTKDNSHLSFGFSRQDESKLISAIKKLCLDLDILKYPVSAADDFIQILLSEDLSTVNKPIFLNCKTVEFSYIIKSLSPFFNSLNPVTIEKSKLFYSKKNILINAQNLYSNTKTDIYKKKDIDKILNQMQ